MRSVSPAAAATVTSEACVFAHEAPTSSLHADATCVYGPHAAPVKTASTVSTGDGQVEISYVPDAHGVNSSQSVRNGFDVRQVGSGSLASVVADPLLKRTV